MLHRTLWKLVPGSSAVPGRPARVPDEETELEGSEESPGEVGRMGIPGGGKNMCDELESNVEDAASLEAQPSTRSVGGGGTREEAGP